MKVLRWCLLAALGLVIVSEVGLRIAGATDVPLYVPGPPYGYIPAPNQRGSFLDRNDYAFNEISMGVARPFEPDPIKTDTLLVGDSIVLGGNPYRQSEKLGPLLEKISGDIVWPISAASWSLSNELIYLERHPEVERGVDKIVFVLNSGDLVDPSDWSSEVTHPTHHPASALVYLASKKLAKVPPAKQFHANPANQWRAFLARPHAPVTVVLYPDKKQASDPAKWALAVASLRAFLGPQVKVFDVGAGKGWSAANYRDDVHPLPSAMPQLATLVREAVR